ncbi:AraC family transcriptional regulator [Marinomonas epiphytica]
MASQGKIENNFYFAKNHLTNDIMILDASMSDFTYATHAHEEFSFGVTLSGRQDFFARGEYFKCPPNSVIVFNPDDAHDGHAGGEDPLHYKMLYIHPNQLRPMLFSAGVKQAEHFRVQECVQYNTAIRQHILRLAHLVENNNTEPLHYDSALFEFAQSLAAQQGTWFEKEKCNKDPVFERVRDYLHSQTSNEVTLDDLSQIAHMSKFHLLRRFKTYFGMTPYKYWQNQRLNKAKKALDLGMAPNDVAFTLGFNDLSHFNRNFKPVFGMTPYQYSQLLKN